MNVPALRSFFDAPEPNNDRPEGGVLFIRKKGTKEFVSESGVILVASSLRISFWQWRDTVTLGSGEAWQRRHAYRGAYGSVAHGRYAQDDIIRLPEGSSPPMHVIVSNEWSKSEVSVGSDKLRGVMLGGKYGFRDAHGKVVVLGWTAWRDLDGAKGIAEFFWHDGHSLGEDWPALALVITKMGDYLRASAEYSD